MLQLAVIAVLVALGIVAFRETMALRRWDAEFFRRGLVIVRDDLPLSSDPARLPPPSDPGAGFLSWPVKSQIVTPLEIVFTAQTTNAPCLKGLLFFDASSHRLVVLGRMFWGALPLLVVGLAMLAALEGAPFVYAFVVVFLAVVGNYLAERRRFRRVLHGTAALLSRI